MLRYVVRMFASEWRQWLPSMGVITVVSAMVGLCVHQFAWTNDPAFRAAVTEAGGSVAEFQILSVTIYTVVALVACVSLTVVGKASVQAMQRSHALWLLMGAAPATVFLTTLLVIIMVSTCGSIAGAAFSTLASIRAIPAFNAAVAPSAALPSFTVYAWAPVGTVLLSVGTAFAGGLMPARQASRTPPSAALRTNNEGHIRGVSSIARVTAGLLSLIVTAALVIAAASADALGSTSPASMFNLAIDAGGCALVFVYLLCPELVTFTYWVLRHIFARASAAIVVLGVRAARDRVNVSATTIAPLVAGLSCIGILLCAVNSVVSVTEILQPGIATDMTDVFTIVTVVAVSMLTTSAAMIALSARGRSREVALLQAVGMHGSQVCLFIASESLAFAIAASAAAVIPIVATGLVSALVSNAALGYAVVEWPATTMIIGALVSWLTLFAVLFVPAIPPLRNGPSNQLRDQGG